MLSVQYKSDNKLGRITMVSVNMVEYHWL